MSGGGEGSGPEAEMDEAGQEAMDTKDKYRSQEDGLMTANKAYIEYELEEGNTSRIQHTYERALRNNCHDVSLWKEYTRYLDENVKMMSEVLPVYERAVKNCAWSLPLWQGYLLSLERFNQPLHVVQSVFDEALQANFSFAENCLQLWKTYISSLRRRINWQGEHSEELEEMRKTIHRAVQYQNQSFKEDGDPNASLKQYLAFVEGKYCQDVSGMRDVWEDILSEGCATQACMWLQYANYERRFGDKEHVRTVYQRAIHSVSDQQEDIFEAFLDFEEEEGSLESLSSFIKMKEQEFSRNELVVSQSPSRSSVTNLTSPSSTSNISSSSTSIGPSSSTSIVPPSLTTVALAPSTSTLKSQPSSACMVLLPPENDIKPDTGSMETCLEEKEEAENVFSRSPVLVKSDPEPLTVVQPSTSTSASQPAASSLSLLTAGDEGIASEEEEVEFTPNNNVSQMMKAKVVLKKLDIGRKPRKCEDCHKVLHPMLILQHCVNKKELNTIRKCDTCMKDATGTINDAVQFNDCEIDIQKEYNGYHQEDFGQNQESNFQSLEHSCKDSHEGTGNTEVIPTEILPFMNNNSSHDEPCRAHLRRHTPSTYTGERLFTCELCSQGFTRKAHLNRHMRNHTGERPFRCKFCSKGFKGSSDLTVHMREHTVERPFKCKLCSKGFNHRGKLSIHMITHTGEKPFKCKLCSKGFTQRGNLNKHMITHTGERPFKCKLCSKDFTQRCNLGVHMTRTHTGERPFKCKLCSKGFNVSSDLTVHMRTHTGERPFKCKLCSKDFTQRSHLNAHMITHTGERPFKCKLCSKDFNQRSNLSEHMRTHTGERPFKCKLCSKGFTRIIRLNGHMRTHTGERPFKCKLCSKDFTRRRNLSEHMRIHTGEKPFKCKLCSKDFTRRGNLNAHMITHTGERPFKCKLCSKDFTQRSNLSEHLRTHAGERPFKCKLCSKGFARRIRLNGHMRTHTKERHFKCKLCSKDFIQRTHHTEHMKTHTQEKIESGILE